MSMVELILNRITGLPEIVLRASFAGKATEPKEDNLAYCKVRGTRPRIIFSDPGLARESS